LAVAVVSSYSTFKILEHIFIEEAVRDAPFDGQAGLGAFMGALDFSIPIFFIVLFGVYIVQRILTRAKSDSAIEFDKSSVDD
jgi:hypothetical protein